MDVRIEAGHGPVHIAMDEDRLRIDASGSADCYDGSAACGADGSTAPAPATTIGP